MNIFKRIKNAIFDNDDSDRVLYEEIITTLKIVKTLPDIDGGLERMRDYKEFDTFYSDLLTVFAHVHESLEYWLAYEKGIYAFDDLIKYRETQLAWIDWMIEYWQKEIDNHLKTR